MAIHDHTARACPSVCNDPEPNVFSDIFDPLCLQSEAQQAADNLTTRLSGVMHGMVTIQGLLDRWLAEQRAHAYGNPLPDLRPLKVQHISGLNAALRVLREQRDRIRSELIE